MINLKTRNAEQWKSAGVSEYISLMAKIVPVLAVISLLCGVMSSVIIKYIDSENFSIALSVLIFAVMCVFLSIMFALFPRRFSKLFTGQVAGDTDEIYHGLFESSPAVAAVYDRELKVLFINRCACSEAGIALPGFAPQDKAGVEEISSEILSVLERTLQTEKPQSLALHDCENEECESGLLITCLPVPDCGGGISEIICTLQSFTKDMEYEEKLREKETMFNALMEFSPVYVFFKDSNIRSIYLSRNYEKMIGLTMDSIIGRTMDELFPSDLAKGMIDDDMRILREGRLVEVDEELNGRYYYTVKFPVKVEGKEPMLAGFTIDITERKTAEKALYDSEEKYRKLHETMHDAFAQVDMNGKIMESNRSFQEMVGYTGEELCLLSFTELTPAKWHKYEKAIIDEQVLPLGSSKLYEKEYIRKDGSVIPVELRTFLLTDNENMPAGMWAIIRDITVRKKEEDLKAEINRDLERMVSERTAELKKLNEELESFSYSVSHDLRAPLRHINGFIELLRSEIGSLPGVKANHYMNVIVSSSLKMGKLIDDLLSFSRIGRQPLKIVHLSMDELVSEVISELNIICGGCITAVIPDTLNHVMADRDLMKVALVNLVSNGVKFSRNSNKPVVKISCINSENESIFVVSDNGIGFEMKYYDKLFKVFNRLHSDSEFEGTGIGLATVKRIIEKHGGRIWAESAPGKGAEFYFSLPSSC